MPEKDLFSISVGRSIVGCHGPTADYPNNIVVPAHITLLNTANADILHVSFARFSWHVSCSVAAQKQIQHNGIAWHQNEAWCRYCALADDDTDFHVDKYARTQTRYKLHMHGDMATDTFYWMRHVIKCDDNIVIQKFSIYYHSCVMKNRVYNWIWHLLACWCSIFRPYERLTAEPTQYLSPYAFAYNAHMPFVYVMCIVLTWPLLLLALRPGRCFFVRYWPAFCSSSHHATEHRRHLPIVCIV